MSIHDETELDRRLRAMPGLESENEDEDDLPFLSPEEEEEEEEDRLFDSDTAAGYEGQGSD